MSYDDYEDLVYAEAKRRMQSEPWYTGVCTNTIYDSWRQDDTIHKAADIACAETYWCDGLHYTPNKINHLA